GGCGAGGSERCLGPRSGARATWSSSISRPAGPLRMLRTLDRAPPDEIVGQPTGSAGQWDGPRVSSASPAFEVRLGHPLEARPVHLSGGCERHFVEDDYLLRRLFADPRARELNQLLARRPLAPIRERDVGADILTVDEVVDPYPPGARHPWVLDQGALDILGADVRAVVNNDLLLAAAEGEVAVVVDSHHIARVQPPAAKGGLGRGGVIPLTRRGRSGPYP